MGFGSALVLSLYSVVDAIMVGRYEGERGMAAVATIIAYSGLYCASRRESNVAISAKPKIEVSSILKPKDRLNGGKELPDHIDDH